jgi:hypothetical protein
MQTSAVSNLITDSHLGERRSARSEALYVRTSSRYQQIWTNFLSEPRDNSVISTLSWTNIGEEQHEVIGNFEPISVNPDTGAGNVRNKTLDLRGAIPKLDRRQTLYAISLRLY